MRLFPLVLVCLTLPLCADAEQRLSPEHLGKRLTAALHIIWPDEIFRTQFEGCRLHLTQESKDVPKQSSDMSIWLGDLATAPAAVYRDGGQLIEDSAGKTTRHHWVIYGWHPDTLARHSADIDRWGQAYDSLFYAEDTTDQQIATFMTDMSDGAYGPFFQRNTAWARMQVDGVETLLEVEEIVWSDPEIGQGLSPLGLVLPATVMEALITDLHLYKQANCPDR